MSIQIHITKQSFLNKSNWRNTLSVCILKCDLKVDTIEKLHLPTNQEVKFSNSIELGEREERKERGSS